MTQKASSEVAVLERKLREAPCSVTLGYEGVPGRQLAQLHGIVAGSYCPKPSGSLLVGGGDQVRCGEWCSIVG